FSKHPKRLRAARKGDSRRTEPLLRGHRGQLLIDELQRRAVVNAIGVLLLKDKLLCVGVGDGGCKPRRGSGRADINDVRFALGASAQVCPDVLFGQALAEASRGLGGHVTRLDELDIRVLLRLLVVNADGLKTRSLLVSLVVVEDQGRCRGVLRDLTLGVSKRRTTS